MLNSKEYALQYFDEKDDTLFALITPAQWLEFANQYGMYVSQNSGKPIVSRSKCDYHAAFTFCGDNGITYCSNCGDPV